MKVHPGSLTGRAVSGMVWVAWGSAAIALLKVAVLVLLTRLLSPADFGLVSAALVVIGFSLNFSQLGLGPALVQRPVLEPRHLSTAFLSSTALGCLAAGIIWCGAPLIARFFHMENLTPVVRVLALVFPVAGVSTVPENLLRRELRFRLLANRDILAYGLGYGVVGVGLALLGWGVWALVTAQLTQAVLQMIILLRAAPPFLHGRPTWRSFVELMEYGIGQSAAAMAVIVANQADNMVVGRWLGAFALGLYGRAYQLMSVPTALLGDVMDRVLFPTLAQLQDDSRRLGTAYLQGTASMALITLPAGVTAAILAPELVTVAFGTRWSALIPPLQVLALGMMFRTGSRMSDSLSRATGRVYRRAWRQVIFAALVFTGALVGQHWGVTGVAIGVLCALGTNYLMMAHLSLSVAQISWGRFAQAQLPALWLTTIIATTTAAAVAATRHFELPSVIGLGIAILVAVASAGAATSLFPTLVLGEYGIRVRAILRTYLLARLRPIRARGSA